MMDEQHSKTLPGLIDVNTLKKCAYVEEKSGQKNQKTAPSQGGVRAAKKPQSQAPTWLNSKKPPNNTKTPIKDNQQTPPLHGRIAG